MNRRSFFKSLGVATAALYLRIAPSAVAEVEKSGGVVNYKRGDLVKIGVTTYECQFGRVSIVSHPMFPEGPEAWALGQAALAKPISA